MKKFNETTLLGNIVAAYPGAADFFIKRQIDFCCGGDRALKIATEDMQLDTEVVLGALNDEYADFQLREETYIDWANEDAGRLIDHIILAHHQFLREELPRLSDLLFKLLVVHGKTHEELFEIHAVFNALRGELESHLVKEELWLFPEIKKLAGAKENNENELRTLLETLEEEHEGAGDALKKLRELTQHYTAPKDGCMTYRLTFDKLRAFEKNMFEHVHLENNIMFKKYS